MPPAGATNTGRKNSQGRTIFRGPRGGEYVLGAGGRVIRSFTRASTPAAAPAPVAATAAAGNTGNKNTKGRTIYRGPRGGEYVLNGTKKVRTFTRATAAAAETRAAAAVAKNLAAMMKLSNTEYISKNGGVYNNQARRMYLSYNQRHNNAATRAFNKNPTFLKKSAIPYIGLNRPNEAFMKKRKLKNSTVMRNGKRWTGELTGVHKKIYFNKYGHLSYLTLNGRKIEVVKLQKPNYYIRNGSRNLRQLKRVIGEYRANYPRGAIPPATPEVRRTSPELLENMMNQIYVGGRGGNVNAGRYTNAEKNVLIRRLAGSIDYFKKQRDSRKSDTIIIRAGLQAPSLTNTQKQTLRNQLAVATERFGYFDDAVRAYTRGLRAVKPLTGAVTPRARAMPATPNRYTPAPANVENNAIYMPLNRPHLVVKTPGAGTIYLNPSTFTGYLKNSARVNLPAANVRNWLRTARRNFPNEPLFRHPLAPKNVTASHIRFSRA